MKLICPLFGITLVSMASLVKADWFANFFDGQWILRPPLPLPISLTFIPFQMKTAASTAERASASVTLAAWRRLAAVRSTYPTMAFSMTITASSSLTVRVAAVSRIQSRCIRTGIVYRSSTPMPLATDSST
jgi:hypothetical protein